MLVGTHQRTTEADDLVIENSNTRLERARQHPILEGPHRIYRSQDLV